MQYKVGDVVRVVDEWPDERFRGEGRDKYLGQAVTIRQCYSEYYTFLEDENDPDLMEGNHWILRPKEIVGLVSDEVLDINSEEFFAILDGGAG